MKYIQFGNEASKLCFDAQKGFLEEIHYGNKKIKLRSKLWSVQTKTGEIGIGDMQSFRCEEHVDCMKLCWQSSAASVVVTVRSGEDRKLRMNIRAEVSDGAISRVKFPILEGLNFGSDNYLLITWQNGHLVKNPVSNFLCKDKQVPFWIGRGKGSFTNEYPAAMSFQYSTFYSPSDFGYYFATEDADAYIKTFTFQYNEKLHAMDYVVTNYPENMGKAASYCMPYDFVLKLFEGDWQDATKIYRAWATEQKWCKKKLCEKKLPENLVKTDLWRINHTNYALGTRTQEYFDTSKMLRDALGCNLAQHWYGWNMSRHDLDYPEYIKDEKKAEGWCDELRSWNKKFDGEGIVKIPYINARLWEKTTESWERENAIVSAIKNEDGALPEEPWNGFQLKPMCPATAMWQNKIQDLCREYVLDEGFDGVYLDQVASFNATLCFDENHPHPLGGGTWWNDTYHSMLKGVRDVLGDERIMTTESCCETYIDVFNLFLILDTCFQHTGIIRLTDGEDVDSVPLFSLIYGEYALSYGSICRFTDRLDRFEYNFMRNLLWGILPSIDGAEMSELEYASAADKITVLKRGVDFYKEHKDVFLYGHLCEIPEYKCSDTCRIDWKTTEEHEYETAFPSICASIWETQEGKKLVFAYNYSEKGSVIELCGKTFNVPAKGFLSIAL